MRTPLLAVAALLLLLSGCGSSPTDTPTESPTDSSETSMNIDETKDHYTRVLQEIQRVVRCGGKPLAWREDRPESIEGAESDDNGDYTAYLYRSPMLVAEQSCHGQEFKDAIAAITQVIEDNGGIKDDVVLNGSDDYAQGGDVKWLD
ncbi:MAG: hypothetical protein EOO74_06565, partial [Myxococcales bacterium]